MFFLPREREACASRDDFSRALSLGGCYNNKDCSASARFEWGMD